MPHKSLDNVTLGHRRSPTTGMWETEVDGAFVPASAAHALTLNTLSPDGDGGDVGGFTFITGQKFQAIRRDDGSMFAFDTATGKPVSGDLAPAAPADPTTPNIRFVHDPNTGDFFSFNEETLVLRVISEETPEVKKGFQHILEADQAVKDAGLDPDKYNFVLENRRVIPKLIEEIPTDQDSFFTSIGADGQLLVVSRLTGASAPIGATPKAEDIPPDATVTIDPTTGRFKVTQPNGQISFPQALNLRELPAQVLKEIKIGGQSFAFNPNTGGFQQVQTPTTPAREFEPGVVTIDGRQFTQGPGGNLTPLLPLPQQFDPDVVVRDGRTFIQGPGGDLTPLGREEVPNLDELINERILSGDAPGALALADFRDRPTSLETFSAAMQFAQSPGDVAAISAIARGQSLVAPPPSGAVQRVAEPPEFLQDAFQRLINQFRGGTGNPEQFIDVLTRINKERDERQTALEAREKELDRAKETNRQHEIDAAIEKAVAPFRQQAGQAGGQEVRTRDDQSLAAGGEEVLADTLRRARESGVPESVIQNALQAGASSPAASQARLLENAVSQYFTSQGAAPFGGIPTPGPKPTGTGVRITSGGRETFDIFAPVAPAGGDPRLAEGSTFFEDTFSNPSIRQLAFNALNRSDSGDDPGPSATEAATQGAADIGLDVSDVDLTSAKSIDEALSAQGIDFFAHGGTAQGRNLEIVGERGPELVDLPPGTLVSPISKLSAAKVKKLKKMGITGMQEGGIVDPLLPFGVRRALAGAAIEPTRRRLSRAAGLPILSAQARQNLLPEELEVFNRLSREAGIPEGAFQQEQESAFPGANLARGRARFAPRVLRSAGA